MLESPKFHLLSSTKRKKKLPIIKVSSGIGDTDGFPAFDAASDTYSVPEDIKWGFRITGGSEFHMPIIVFQVSEDGLAYKGGIRLGDIILKINDVDTTNLTLAQANELINEAYDKLYLVARKMEEETAEHNEENEEKPIEEKSVVLRRRLPPKIPDPPKEQNDVDDNIPKLNNKDEFESKRELTEEELIKKKKREKIQQVEQSWPWSERQKPIYRESTCHLVPKLSIVESRIKQLGEGKVLSFCQREKAEGTR